MNTVFITGADRGIGFALCEFFIELDWTVIAGQFMPEWPQLANLAELTKANGRRLEIVPLDVGDDDSVRAAAKTVAGMTGTVDMLINCAGIAGGDSEEHIRAMMNINSIGPIRVTQAFLPLMEKGMRRICFLSSEAGITTLAHRTGHAGYCLSKTALNMAVRLMFNELQPKGYTFRLYHPGWVRSYMSGSKSETGRFEPEEAANVAFLQFLNDRPWEDVLVMTDIRDEAWPF